MYLSTVLDDFSRYIISWKLCTTMKAEDVTDTLDLALEASGCNQATVVNKPRLLSDNGSSYVAADLADYLEGKVMDHVRGAPNHPQTHYPIILLHISHDTPDTPHSSHSTSHSRIARSTSPPIR